MADNQMLKINQSVTSLFNVCRGIPVRKRGDG